MEYIYKITGNDNFDKYSYISWNNSIVRFTRTYDERIKSNRYYVSIFDQNSKNFTSFEELQFVEYNDLKNVTYHLLGTDKIYLIDIENREYSYSTKYPFWLLLFDGNTIESCHYQNKIYIFHSETEYYDTGIFIFDILSNRFNNSDYQLMETQLEAQLIPHTNRFKNLHKKTITSCSIDNNNIYILWHYMDDNETVDLETADSETPRSEIVDMIRLSKYDPATDELTNILIPEETKWWYKYIVVIDDIAYINSGDIYLYIYDIGSRVLLKLLKIYNNNNDNNDNTMEFSFLTGDPIGGSQLIFVCKEINSEPPLDTYIIKYDIKKLLK